MGSPPYEPPFIDYESPNQDKWEQSSFDAQFFSDWAFAKMCRGISAALLPPAPPHR